MSIPVGTYEAIMKIMLRLKPCGFSWLGTGVFRKKVPWYGIASHWVPVYDQASIIAAITAARTSELPPSNPQPLDQVKIRKW